MKKQAYAIKTMVIFGLFCMMMLQGVPLMADENEIPLKGAKSDSFQVTFEPVKPVFTLNESIRFKIKGNKTFYLYLFSVDEEKKLATMILPNIKQQYHKYRAGDEFMVPEKNIEFFSDSAGVEKIIMVASLEKLALDTKHYKKSGNYYALDADLFKQDFGLKSIRIRDTEEPKPERIVEKISVLITEDRSRDQEESTPQVEPTEPVCAFVATDRLHYQAGESMKIIYGADQAGFVFLYMVDADGTVQLLTKTKVNGKAIYKKKGLALEPAGSHQLIAVYDEDGTVKDAELKTVRDTLQKTNSTQKTTTVKTIQLVEERPHPFAVYNLIIEKGE